MAFALHAGVNVTDWLPPGSVLGNWRWRGLEAADLRRLADWGFDHVRLPAHEIELYDRRDRRRGRAWDQMRRVLDLCRAQNLRVVFDLHRVRSHDQFAHTARPDDLFHNPAAIARLADIWRDLSSELHGIGTDALAYDLFNEARAPSPEAWHGLFGRLLAAVRQREPHRTVLLGPYRFQALSFFDSLEVPDDPNLLLAFHFYRPYMFTHYRVPWARPWGYEGPIRYPGRPVPEKHIHEAPARLRESHTFLPKWNDPWSAAHTAALLATALHHAGAHRRRLYCSEFGCANTVPPDLRRLWFNDFLSLLRSNGVSWCVWAYRGQFGLLDETGQPSPALPLLLEYAKNGSASRR